MNYLQKFQGKFDQLFKYREQLWNWRELERCTFCPRLCRHVCPAALGEYRETAIPTQKVASVYLWQRGELPLTEDLSKLFFACSDCGACTAFCKHRAEPQSILLKARREAFKRGVVPREVRETVERIVRDGSPEGPLDTSSLGDLPVGNTHIQLFLGCSVLKRGGELPKLLFDGARLSASVPLSLFPPELCCGAPLYALGAEEEHRKFAQRFARALKSVRTLIVADPHCAYHLRKVYPALGIELPQYVVDLLEVIERLNFDKTRSPLARAYYLDPSPLGRFQGVYDLPRSLLARANIEVLEFSRNRFFAWDSAAGGAYRYVYPEGAKRYLRWLFREFLLGELDRSGGAGESPLDSELTRSLSDELNLPFIERQNLKFELPPIFTVGERERSFLSENLPEFEFFELQEFIIRLAEGHFSGS